MAAKLTRGEASVFQSKSFSQKSFSAKSWLFDRLVQQVEEFLLSIGGGGVYQFNRRNGGRDNNEQIAIEDEELLEFLTIFIKFREATHGNTF